MSKNHFVSHFLPFQINTTIFIIVIFFYKMAASGHFGCPKITFGRISGHFRSIQNFYFLFLQNGCHRPFWMSEIHFGPHFWLFSTDFVIILYIVFYKMASGGHFGCPKITFDLISIHFTSIRNFNFF